MNNDVFATGQTPNANDVSVEPVAAAWMAVFSLAMGVFGLLTAEYLPASLLTPMAFDLGVSEALAGQAVTVTAVVAMFAGLSVPRLTRHFDRRVVLLAFTVLMIASNLLVALSSSLTVLLVMRILLGVALGGFWSMAAAVAMRLVPAKLVPRALSIIFSGIAIGTVVSVPLGSYLGGAIWLAQCIYSSRGCRRANTFVSIVHAAPYGAAHHDAHHIGTGIAPSPGDRDRDVGLRTCPYGAICIVHLYSPRA